MFQAEEILEHKIVDFTKVQVFFFTIMGIMGYVQALWEPFSPISPGEVLEFPALSTSLTTIIGISHAGYLAAKAIPRTPTESLEGEGAKG